MFIYLWWKNLITKQWYEIKFLELKARHSQAEKLIDCTKKMPSKTQKLAD